MKRDSAPRSSPAGMLRDLPVCGFFLGVALAVILCAPGPASATPTLSVDEDGHVTSEGVNSFGGTFFFVASDPVNPTSGPALIYRLGFVVTAGDVFLNNTADVHNPSDIVRFIPQGINDPGSGWMVFYSPRSAAEPVGDSLADTAVYNPFYQLTTTIDEVGPEGPHYGHFARSRTVKSAPPKSRSRRFQRHRSQGTQANESGDCPLKAVA